MTFQSCHKPSKGGYRTQKNPVSPLTLIRESQSASRSAPHACRLRQTHLKKPVAGIEPTAKCSATSFCVATTQAKSESQELHLLDRLFKSQLRVQLWISTPARSPALSGLLESTSRSPACRCPRRYRIEKRIPAGGFVSLSPILRFMWAKRPDSLLRQYLEWHFLATSGRRSCRLIFCRRRLLRFLAFNHPSIDAIDDPVLGSSRNLIANLVVHELANRLPVLF